ncbi:MAG: TolC family protein [Flavobacteriales bacterium]|nr:hypothetical protein [Flavobacteriales bacterium]MCC6577843.1 TolC family protein [Flavobacteriales bacterium]NUQ14563.1 TolC family protein [Flavobacteriales bacterium]
MRSIAPLLLLIAPLAHAQTAWTLAQCVQRAEERNLTLRSAGLDTELADRTREQSFWSFFPDLNGGATHGYNYGRVIDRFTNTFATDRVRTNNFYLSSDLTVFNGLRLHNERRRAGLDLEAAREGGNAVRNDVRATVARQFVEVLSAEERIRAGEAQLASATAQVERMQTLVEAGRNALSELINLRSQQAQQEYALVDLRNRRDQSLLLLAQTLQLTAEELSTFTIAAPALAAMNIAEPTADVEHVLTTVLAQDPLYKQAELRAASADRGVAIARSGSYPVISFNASAGTGYSGRNLESIGDPIVGPPLQIGYTAGNEAVYAPNVDYETRVRPFGKQLDDNLNESLGLTLSVPIFNNRRTELAVSQARIQQEKAELELVNVRDRRRRDVQDAILAQRAAYQQHQAAERSVEAAAENLRLTEARYEQGAANALELNTARNDLQRATADRITARYSYVLAAMLLDILQGIPLAH